MFGLHLHDSVDEVSSVNSYNANCHCGTVRLTFSLPQPLGSSEYPVMNCNCSICRINGYLNVYPKREDLNISQGYENLGEYKMGEKKKVHKFCKTCGTSILIDFRKLELGITDIPEEDTLAINVRTVEGIDLKTLEYKEFDGYNILEPQYDIHRDSEATPPSRSSPSPSPPQFSLAGNHLPVTHQTAVIDVKERDEPTWSLARPLPRVDRSN